MKLLNVEPKWYFIICIAIFIIITVRSITLQKGRGRMSTAAYRRKGFLITVIAVFIIFVAGKKDLFSTLQVYSLANDNNTVVYSSEVGEAIAAIKSGDFDSSKYTFGNQDHYDYSDSYASEESSDHYSESTASDSNDKDDGITLAIVEMDTIPDNWVQINPAGVKASASLKKYPAEMLIDGDISTSWQVEVSDYEKFNEDDDTSEYLYFGFGAKKNIDYIVIYNGTPDSESRYYKNGRAKTLKIADLSIDPHDRSNYLWTETPELKDDPAFSVIECHNLYTEELYMVINTMFPGEKYRELCITDVMFYSEE